MNQLEPLVRVPALSPATVAKITASMADFAAAMTKVAAVFNTKILTGSRLRRMFGLPLRDEHHPPVLCIDGAAYHRRRNARRRRR